MTEENALYIVATPIGNLSDITFRAVEILRSVSVIAAEDTRHSAKLLHFYSIETPLISYHDHGGEHQEDRILSRLIDGKSVALISDAGTPLISDPGYRLVNAVSKLGVKVVPLPGASALIAGLCASGLPSDRFSFEGFAPAKANARLALFEKLCGDPRTLIFYESTHRIRESLADMSSVFGPSRRCVVARELTKSFETFIRGSIEEIIATIDSDSNQKKGEFVVMVSGHSVGKTEDLSDEARRVLTVLLQELPVKQASALAATLTGEKKNKLYQWALSQKV